MDASELTEEERTALIESIPYITDVSKYNENITSRNTGRSFSTLKKIMSMTVDEKKKFLRDGHAAFKELLKIMGDGDRDPLQIYIDYLNWMHDVYPEGPSIDSGYDNVLKEAADKFQDVTKYKNDLRYLKIWLELARKKPEPRNIFHFLIQKDIGQQKSLFYENYALYHEEREEYDAVKEVFKTGIAKCAHPLERLQRLYNEFKCRFNEKVKRGLITAPVPEYKLRMDALKRTGHRTMLGRKLSANSSISMPENIYQRTVNRAGGRPLSIGHRIHHESTSIRESPSDSPSFSVYVDPVQDKKVRPFETSSVVTNTHIMSDQVENKPVIQKFSEVRVPQRDVPHIVHTPFTVYQDPEDGEEEDDEEDLKSTSASLRDSPERENPLHKRNSLQETQSSRKKVKLDSGTHRMELHFLENRDTFYCSTDSRGHPEYIMYSKSFENDVSFEEHRARLSKYRNFNVRRKGKGTEKIDLFAPDDEREKRLREYGGNRSPSPVDEYTTRTYNGIQFINNIFSVGDQIDDEEADLTWNNTCQSFEEFKPRVADENA